MDNKSNNQKSIISFETATDVYDFLQQPTVAIAEFLTGVLSSDQSIYKLSAGRLVQGAIKGRLLTQLGREIKEYREKGEIKEDYFATNKNQATLLELLQFIDSDIPDEEVFNAMKAIFFSSIAKDASSKEEEVGYQLLQLCKKLNSIEILILKVCYRVYLGEDTENVNTGNNDFGVWVNTVSEKIGYDLPELISASDDKLVELGLLSGRGYSDKSSIRTGKEFRLTKLSIKLVEHISRWELKK